MSQEKKAIRRIVFAALPGAPMSWRRRWKRETTRVASARQLSCWK